jgi:hypothetical protein
MCSVCVAWASHGLAAGVQWAVPGSLETQGTLQASSDLASEAPASFSWCSHFKGDTKAASPEGNCGGDLSPSSPWGIKGLLQKSRQDGKYWAVSGKGRLSK